MSPEVFEAGSKYSKALAISLPDNFANERGTRKLRTEIVKNQAENVLNTFDLTTTPTTVAVYSSRVGTARFGVESNWGWK